MNRVFTIVTTALLSLLVLSLNSAAADGVAIGDKAPAFELEDQNGKAIKLADFEDKIVVLEWVNPDCPFVQRHAKTGTMRTLATQYEDNDVVWLAINSTHYMSAEDSAKYRTSAKLAYPILADASGEIGHAYGAKTTPHMFIVDKDGKIAYMGGIDDDPRGSKGKDATNHVAAALDELVGGESVSVSETKPYGCSVKYAK